jgi:hypothetical protein
MGPKRQGKDLDWTSGTHNFSTRTLLEPSTLVPTLIEFRTLSKHQSSTLFHPDLTLSILYTDLVLWGSPDNVYILIHVVVTLKSSRFPSWQSPILYTVFLVDTSIPTHYFFLYCKDADQPTLIKRATSLPSTSQRGCMPTFNTFQPVSFPYHAPCLR